jgi:serine/threonine protein kinase
MELLKGEALKHRIAGKPVPVSALLDWAVQIGGGLAAAHADGVVHRDLKPANLFITNGGQGRFSTSGSPSCVGNDNPRQQLAPSKARQRY